MAAETGLGTESPSRVRRRWFQIPVIARSGSPLSFVGYISLMIVGTVSICMSYLLGTGNLDIALAIVSLIALASAITTPPKEAWWVGGLLLIYCVIALGATLNVPKNTWPEEIARALATIIFSSLLFFAGYAARIRLTRKMLQIIEWFSMAMYLLLMGTVIAKHGGMSKNIIGGMSFEITMIWAAARFARLGVIGNIPLAIGGALLFAGIASGHRLIAGIAIPMGFTLWIFQYVHRPIFRIIPPLLAISIALFSVWLFMNYTNVAAFAGVDKIVTAQTGRSALSGRQDIWRPLLEAAANAPALGYGPTVKASDISGENLSTHNAYIYIWLQTGPTGFFVVCAVIGALIIQSVTSKNRLAAAMLCTFLLGVLVHNTYENVLFTNCFPIASLCWLNMGFYVAACKFAIPGAQRAKRRIAPMIRPEDLVVRRPW